MEFFSIKDIASRRLSQDLLPMREIQSSHARKKPTLHISIECEEDANQPDSNRNAKTPRVLPTRSKSGSLQIGDFKIQYKGLKNSDKNESHLHGLLSFQPNISQVTNHKDFVQIRTLGKGNSGSVVEAIHIPTMTIVAIKILPITNIDGLQYICNELSVLRENYMELCMVAVENPNVSCHSFDNSNNATMNYNSDINMSLNNSNDATEKQNDHNTFDTSMIKCKKQNLRRRSISSLIDHQSKCPQVLGLYDGKILEMGM